MSRELAWIAEAVGATHVRRRERIQRLWSGYGELFRVELAGAEAESAIVKWVTPPSLGSKARADRSHARKCRSYDVEMAWYRGAASRCDDTCRVPALLASRAAENEWLFVLEDLDAAGYAERQRDLSPAALGACLAWLASFHGRFLGVAPSGLWKTGTYWHLGTRPDELAAIEDRALRDAAPALDRALGDCRYKTLVHGDAKPANFCFTRGANRVAAVDFQYVGGGCGMKDVAYLLSGACANEREEQQHLATYFRTLGTSIATWQPSVDARDVEDEWTRLYPIACADYHRFIAGWAKEHWRSDREGQRVVARVLRALG